MKGLKEMPLAEGFVKNCILEPKNNTDTLFVQREDGTIVPFLDGYAIMPIERYEALTKVKSE